MEQLASARADALPTFAAATLIDVHDAGATRAASDTCLERVLTGTKQRAKEIVSLSLL